MRIPFQVRTVKRTLVILIILAGAVACGSPKPLLRDRLDPATGVTITDAGAPIVFYSDGSARAAYARDFVYLGPIEVNRMGQRRYFLWLSVLSTMRDDDPGTGLDAFESVIVFADGEPLVLSLTGRTPSAIGASQSVYLRPSASPADGYYEVTADQLRLIAHARDLRIESTGRRGRSYEPWKEQDAGRRGIQAFADYLSF